MVVLVLASVELLEGLDSAQACNAFDLLVNANMNDRASQMVRKNTKSHNKVLVRRIIPSLAYHKRTRD